MSQRARYLLAAARIALGWTFLWAFIDKLLGLGLSTQPENAWIRGGSPTFGFLSFGSSGLLSGFYQSIAGHPVVDGLFMLGLLGLGTALMLGIGMRIAGIAGPAMMLLMWSANLPPTTNPVIDSHIIFALIIVACAAADVGKVWGLGNWWAGKVGEMAPVLV
jgi:thiosulfate dehydrogenase (quinone) large subunit